jgi:chaperone required for assembly of F1-ATPase
MKKELVLPSEILVNEVLREWDQNSDNINIDDLVFYGVLSTAIDKVNLKKDAYVNDIIDFIDTDLICYRAESPNDLIALQNKSWNPILLLIEKYIDVKIKVFKGIMPSNQDQKVHTEIKKLISNLSDVQISVLHRITNLIGSIFLSLCILKKDLLKEDAFECSFLDELWQAKNWGHEEDASIKRNKIRLELNRLIHFVNCIEI